MIDFPTHTNCTQIGNVTRANGTKGEIVIRINPQINIDFDSISHMFIEVNQLLVPFSIQTFSIKKNSLFIHFTDITSESYAEEFLLHSVFVENHAVIQQATTSSNKYIGYSILDKNIYIGIIKEVLELPMHEVFRVITTDNKEILVPHAENLIIEINADTKHIIMDVPEGLIDVYIS